jgi:hypothetical protein
MHLVLQYSGHIHNIYFICFPCFYFQDISSNYVAKSLHFPGCLIVVLAFCNTSSVKLVIFCCTDAILDYVSMKIVFITVTINHKKPELTALDLEERIQ